MQRQARLVQQLAAKAAEEVVVVCGLARLSSSLPPFPKPDYVVALITYPACHELGYW